MFNEPAPTTLSTSARNREVWIYEQITQMKFWLGPMGERR
jgi:hypothetical protein